MRNKLIVLVSLLLWGCSEAPSEANETYVARLSTILSVSQANTYRETQWHKPSVKKPTFSTTMSVLSLAKIQGCKLSTLIADHNNQLGKVAKPSIEFDYHLQFLSTVNDCLLTVEDDEIKRALVMAKEEKARLLPKVYDYALSYDDSLKKLYLPATHALSQTKNGDRIQFLTALTELYTLNQNLDKNETINRQTRLTQLSQAITRDNYGVRLIRALREQEYLTDNLTTQLSRIDINKLCKENHSNADAKVLANIFIKYFAETLQPYHSYLIQEGERILPMLADLYSHNQLADIKTLPNQLKRASKNHALWWQGFYRQCNLVPGKHY